MSITWGFWGITWPLLAILAMAMTVSDAKAQTISQPTPPEFYSIDERGVDLVTGAFNYALTDVAIGPPDQGGLSRTRGSYTNGWRDAVQGGLNISGNTYVVTLGLESQAFTFNGSTYVPTNNVGSTLTRSGDVYTFTTAIGDVGRFSTQYCATPTGQLCTSAAALYEMVSPSGEQTTYNYLSTQYVRSIDPNGNPVYGTIIRLSSVTNNRGYRLQFAYQSNSMTGGGTLNEKVGRYLNVTSVTGLNQTVETCSATGCNNFAEVWPSASYATDSNGNQTVTDQSGRQTIYTLNGGSLIGIRYPGSATDDVSVSYAAGKVSGVTDATGAWNYTFVDQGNTRTATSNGPQGQQTVVVTDLTIGRPSTVTIKTGASSSSTWAYLYDTQRRVRRITDPELNYTDFLHDARGNLTRTTRVPKPGPTLASIVTIATYPSTCTNPRICNQPTSTTDPRGHVTNYTYDATHGGITAITEPAPQAGADRPQTRITYEPRHAFYKNSSGVITQATTPITLPIRVSACTVGTSCIGDPEEIRTTMTYGTSGIANNLLPTTTTTGAGNGTDNSTVTLTYTSDGDVETVDGPLTTQSDVTRYIYDEARQLIGVIGPDPDGGGPLLNRATKVSYNPDGTVGIREIGTTTGQGPSALSTFNSLQQASIEYDDYQRPIQNTFAAGGTLYSLNQLIYDASGRPYCQVQRMNRANWLNPPNCALNATGGDGPDRIAVTTYDLAGRPTAVTSGFATSAALTESSTWTANGLPRTFTDGQGNISTMEYDRFDRVDRMRYPDIAGGGSSTSDYTAYTYDAASNVLTNRTRANQTFTTVYDRLNRPTSTDAPSGTDDLTYTYDNLGRPLSATIVGNPPQTTAMTWDALGRQTTETTSFGQMQMQFDPAGRRTRLTWPDGFVVSYRYDATGEMTALRQGDDPSPTLIASYLYDNLGQRTSISRSNGVSTTYGYDTGSRLTFLRHDLVGTANDQSYTYGYNPSGQITSLSSTNDTFAYTALTPGTDAYAIDGLNRVTQVTGSAPLTYDQNGNLIGDGTRTFAYDAANRLRSTSANSGTILYDALGRLREVIGTIGARYLSDGMEPAGIYPSNGSPTIQARFIRGPWPDELVGTYQGPDATSTLNFQLQDHLGSSVAIVGPTGAIVGAPLAYDDYGVPRTGNGGRFMYTGQLWLPDFGMYHYKARAYHPGLGRFAQTDPVGTEGGTNLYAYTGADPVNLTDPEGLQGRRPVTGRGNGRYGEAGYRPPVNLRDVLSVNPRANFPQSFGRSSRSYRETLNFRDAHLEIIRIFGRGNLDGSRTSRLDDAGGALAQTIRHNMSNLTREGTLRSGNQYSAAGGYGGANALFRAFTGRDIARSGDYARVQIDARTTAYVNFHYSTGQGGGQRFARQPTIDVRVERYVTGSRIAATFRFKIRYVPTNSS